MNIFFKPRIVISKCIEFESCRWNGLMIESSFVKKLKSLVEFIPVCPELEIGLGVPRKPIRVVVKNNKKYLLQNETEADLTNKMNNFANSYLNSLENIDGFILKDRSPSCGSKDVKIYPALGKVSPVAGNGSGLFGAQVLSMYSHLAVENEGRLNNFTLRENFLTKVFLFSSFRKLKEDITIHKIMNFQAQNKLLLMAYNQTVMRKLGKIIANSQKGFIKETIIEYEKLLYQAFSKIPRYTSNINVLMHALGYFSKKLNSKEKSFFLEMLEKYRKKLVPLSNCIVIIREWIVRFNEEYLENQTYFNPYPEELIEITDSGKGRGQ